MQEGFLLVPETSGEWQVTCLLPGGVQFSNKEQRHTVTYLAYLWVLSPRLTGKGL